MGADPEMHAQDGNAGFWEDIPQALEVSAEARKIQSEYVDSLPQDFGALYFYNPEGDRMIHPTGRVSHPTTAMLPNCNLTN